MTPQPLPDLWIDWHTLFQTFLTHSEDTLAGVAHICTLRIGTGIEFVQFH